MVETGREFPYGVEFEIETLDAGIGYLQKTIDSTQEFPFTLPEDVTPTSALESFLELINRRKEREERLERIRKYTLPYAYKKRGALLKELEELSKSNPSEDLKNSENDSETNKSVDDLLLPETTVRLDSLPTSTGLEEPDPEKLITDKKEKKKAKKSTSQPKSPIQKATHPKQPRAEKIDPNLIVIDMVNSRVSLGTLQTPMMYHAHTRMMAKIAQQGGQAKLADFLNKEELDDIATVHQLEQIVRKMVSDLEKDPRNPQILSVTGSGKTLSIWLLKPIHLIQKDE
jgi:hypothetical protein